MGIAAVAMPIIVIAALRPEGLLAGRRSLAGRLACAPEPAQALGKCGPGRLELRNLLKAGFPGGHLGVVNNGIRSLVGYMEAYREA